VPTVLLILGWRFYFYANENNEPIHIHVQKADAEAKFWLDTDLFEVREAFAYNLSQKYKRQVRKIIFEHFDYIIEQWKLFHQKKLY
jgi:fructose-1,6-bisphosphatase